MPRRAERLWLVQYGAERVPKSLSLRDGPPELYWEPLTGVVVDTGEGAVLFDTGMARVAHDAPEVERSYVAASGQAPDAAPATPWHLHPAPPDPGRWTWGWPGDPLVHALAGIGMRPEDVRLAVVSHLHLDHSGGVPTLAAAGVPVAVQARELDFARSGAVGLAEGFHRPDWDDPATQWVLLDGEAEVAPGVRVLDTPGHTPGHCSLAVELEATGTWIFTADATDLAQNLLDRVPCGSCAGGDVDAPLAESSLERLLAEAARSGARLVPGHDQVVWTAAGHPRGGHR